VRFTAGSQVLRGPCTWKTLCEIALKDRLSESISYSLAVSVLRLQIALA
jgi:hypothetical protein